MKNAIKKLTAIAMAFILLGAGTDLSRKLPSCIQTTLTANAITCTNCHGGSSWVTTKSQSIGLHQKVYNHTCGLCGKQWTTTACDHGKVRRYTSDWVSCGSIEYKSWCQWSYNYSRTYEDYCPYCNKVLARGVRYKHKVFNPSILNYTSFEDDKPNAF